MSSSNLLENKFFNNLRYISVLSNDAEKYPEKFTGIYETVLDDYNPAEAWVLTEIKKDGTTLSTFYNTPSKDIATDTVDGFTQLYKLTENSYIFSRIYNYDRPFMVHGNTLFHYNVAKHILYFTDDGNYLYTEANYLSRENINLKPDYIPLAAELGYIVEGSRLNTRLHKRVKII